MSVDVEKLSNLERRVSISIPAEKIEDEISKRLHALAPEIKIDGFRPGKVPFGIIEKRYKATVLNEVLENLVKSFYADALEQEKLKPVTPPQIELSQYKPSEPFSYVAKFEIIPEIKLSDFSEIQVEKMIGEITEQDLDDTIELLRKQRGNWWEVTRGAKDGDKVVFDYVDDASGEVVRDCTLELGTVPLLADFEKKIYGAKVGDDLRVNISYSPNYNRMDLAGKMVDFSVRVKKVMELELPPIDSDFAKSCGIESGDIDAFRCELRENMQKELDQALSSRLRQSIIRQLVAKNPIELPKALIEEEVKAIYVHKKQEQKRYERILPFFNLKPIVTISDEQIERDARYNVAAKLLLNAVIDLLDIKLNSSVFSAQVARLAMLHNVPPKKIPQWYEKNIRQMDYLKLSLLEKLAAEALQEQVKLVERKVSYKEILQNLIDNRDYEDVS